MDFLPAAIRTTFRGLVFSRLPREFFSIEHCELSRESAVGEADSFLLLIGPNSSRKDQTPAQITLCSHDVEEFFQVFFN